MSSNNYQLLLSDLLKSLEEKYEETNFE